MKNVKEQTPKIDIEAIKKQTKLFVEKEFETDGLPLFKKVSLENKPLIVFGYDTIVKEGKTFYNFKALNETDTPICFNGSDILKTQLESNGMPCKVKLVKKERPNDALKPYYWIFVKA